MSTSLNVRPFGVAYGKIKLLESREKATNGRCAVPIDVVLQVFANFKDERRTHHAPFYYTKSVLQPTLYAATLVSKSWSEAATELLYRDILLSSTQNLSSLSNTLCQRADLRPLVRSFAFIQGYARSCDEYPDPCSPHTEAQLKLIHILCPSLHFESLKSRSPTPKHCSEYLTVALHEAKCMQLWNAERNSITRLDIEPLDNFSHAFFRLGDEFSFHTLEHLVIRHYAVVGLEDIPPKWPNMPRLRRLCLYDCDVFAQDDFLPGSSRLLALEIIGGRYEISDLWAPIIAIGGSLEFLTILPSGTTNRAPLVERLSRLRSLAVLHLCQDLFHDGPPSSLDPSSLFPSCLVYLGIVHADGLSIPDFSPIYNCVTKAIGCKKEKGGFLQLKYVRFNGWDETLEQQKGLGLAASGREAEIEVSWGISPFNGLGLRYVDHVRHICLHCIFKFVVDSLDVFDQ